MKLFFKIIVFNAALLLQLNLSAQLLKSVVLKPNLVNEFSLSIEFNINIDDGAVINTDYQQSDKLQFRLTYAGNSDESKSCRLTAERYFNQSGFGFKVSGFNQYALNLFLAKDNQIGFEVVNDLQIQLIGLDKKTKLCLFKKDDINKMIKENLSIADTARTSYITALNNFYYYQNSFDFGIKPSQDSSSSSYFFTFNFQNKYSFKNILKCNSKVSKNDPHLFWNLTGRVSTNFNDSLNYINYYPINVAFSRYDGMLPYELNFKLGNEANQTFSNKRIVIDGAYTLIIPNFINLAATNSNRLRLKPIITLGLKGYYDYSNETTHFLSGQAYFNLHYYIPVFTNYAIIIDENPFYDFSIEKNPSHKVQNSYSITLGAEITKTGFKAMFKYINGVSNINYKEGQIIEIGLLMDFLQEKINKN